MSVSLTVRCRGLLLLDCGLVSPSGPTTSRVLSGGDGRSAAVGGVSGAVADTCRMQPVSEWSACCRTQQARAASHSVMTPLAASARRHYSTRANNFCRQPRPLPVTSLQLSQSEKRSLVTSLQLSQSAKRSFVTSAGSRQLRRSSTLGVAQQVDCSPVVKTSDDDVRDMYSDVIQALSSTTKNALLHDIACYYFDGQGKAVRPVVTCLMARAVNAHTQPHLSHLMTSQRQVAIITEMIHTASLVHDDVIDASDTRRGKPSVNKCWGQKRAIMAGDYILSVASTMLARIRNDDVTQVLSQVLADLVQGEFMQLGAKENETERFAHYLAKTFKKTASLIAYSCRAVAILAEADESIQEVAYQYGRNVGMAFQLVDDLLDFISSSNLMGKPAAADLRLGLATAPVLFACEKYPELNPMIMRRFSEPGDVEHAYKCVMDSEGLHQTRILAESHCREAIRQISQLASSEEQRSLISITDRVLNRMK